MIAKSLINHNLSALRTTDTVEAAIAFMMQMGVTELPIIENKKVYNYARLSQLATLPKNQSLEVAIAKHPYPALATETNHLYELIPLLAANDLSNLAVCNDQGEFIGVVEQKLINNYIADSLTYKGLGAILVLHLDGKDYAPSLLARLVEENGAKILGLVIRNGEDGRLWVNIKLNTTVVKPIVASLKRYSIQVENIFLAEDHDGNSDKEYDMIMRFFDI